MGGVLIDRIISDVRVVSCCGSQIMPRPDSRAQVRELNLEMYCYAEPFFVCKKIDIRKNLFAVPTKIPMSEFIQNDFKPKICQTETYEKLYPGHIIVVAAGPSQTNKGYKPK